MQATTSDDVEGDADATGAAPAAAAAGDAVAPSASRVGVVGIIVNPLAGTDVRRLVTGAAAMPDMAKVGIIRRALIGASAGGAQRVVLTDDRRALAARAIEELHRERSREFDAAGTDIEFELLPGPPFDARRNTVLAAEELHDLGVGAVIVLGGDGTHRDVVSGWRRAPLVALSTGTNNVFPRAHESTLAGHAAAAVASGAVELRHVAWRAKVIDVRVDVEQDGATTTVDDVAVVDLALVEHDHIGSRAVWNPASLSELVCTIAEPASVGLSAIAAAALPCGRREPGGVHLRLRGHHHQPATVGTSGGSDAHDRPARAGAAGGTHDHDHDGQPEPHDHGGAARRVRVPIAPGRYGNVDVHGAQRVANGESVEFDTRHGGVLSIDGERDLLVRPGARVTATISPDGPDVIDVEAALTAWYAAGGATVPPTESSEQDH